MREAAWERAGEEDVRLRGWAVPAAACGVLEVREGEESADFSTAPGFTPQHLLEGDLPDISREEQAKLLHRHLVQLQRAEADVDLALGEGLAKLKTAGAFTLHGASTFGTYCTGVLGFSSAHASEVVRMQARLKELPLMEGAFKAGLIGRSHLRVVLPHARPEHDAALAGLCRTKSVRALVEIVKSGVLAEDGKLPAPTVEELEAAEEKVNLSLSMTPQERAQVMGWGRAMVRAVIGGDAPTWQCFEALAADMLSASGEWGLTAPAKPVARGCACARGPSSPGASERVDVELAGQASPSPREAASEMCACAREGQAREAPRGGARQAGEAPPRGAVREHGPQPHAARRRKRTRRERIDLCAAAKRARKDLLRRLDALPIAKLPDLARAQDPHALDEALRDLVRLRRTIECERALLLLWMDRRRLYLGLGHPRFAEYVEHRLGLSPREASEAVELQSKLLMRCTGLAREYRSGALPAHVVSLLRLVVRADNEEEWIAHAKRCSYKRLLLEVDVLLALRGSMAPPKWEELTKGGRPLSELTLQQLQLDFQEAHGARERRRRRKADRVLAGRRGACMESEEDEEETPTLTWAKASIVTVEAPEGAAQVIREALEAVKRKVGAPITDGSALILMLREFLVTYAGDPTVQERAWKVAILDRDGWQCSMPHCRRRCGLEVHHVVYRSHEGPDEPWNLLTLCGPCHRHLQHAGRVRISGRAPESLTVEWGGPEHAQVWRHGIRIA